VYEFKVGSLFYAFLFKPEYIHSRMQRLCLSHVCMVQGWWHCPNCSSPQKCCAENYHWKSYSGL